MVLMGDGEWEKHVLAGLADKLGAPGDRDSHVRELIAQASVEELQEAFPELISALRALVEGQTI